MKTKNYKIVFTWMFNLSATLVFFIFSLPMSAKTSSLLSISTTTVERHRVWLNLTGPQSSFSQTLIGYRTGATDGVDPGLDGALFNDGAVCLYTLINNDRYAIQFRGFPFSSSSMMPLSFSTTISGNFTLSIDHMDGLFLDPAQPIYVFDEANNNFVNLKTSNYTFSATAGVYNNRFRVYYQNTLDITNNTIEAKDLMVSNSFDKIVINTGNYVLANVAVFTIDGKMVYIQNNINSSELSIPKTFANNQPIIIKATTDNGSIVSKKWLYIR